MTGEKTKILGKIGDFEIGARWQWKLPLHMITLCVLVLILISLLLLVAGFFYLRIQFLQMSKIQSELQVQLEEVQRLKGEFAAIATQSHGISVPPASIRFKRGSSSRRVTAVHLERNVTYVNTGNSGIIGQWFPQYWSEPQYYLENIKLEEAKSSLIIQTTGLYIIYAQLCYATTKENNSFEVRLMNQGLSQKQSRTIAQCSAGTSNSDSEVTCFTSIVQVLESGDRVFLQQLQKNRHLLMNYGRSFMGVVKLSD